MCKFSFWYICVSGYACTNSHAARRQHQIPGTSYEVLDTSVHRYLAVTTALTSFTFSHQVYSWERRRKSLSVPLTFLLQAECVKTIHIYQRPSPMSPSIVLYQRCKRTANIETQDFSSEGDFTHYCLLLESFWWERRIDFCMVCLLVLEIEFYQIP